MGRRSEKNTTHTDFIIESFRRFSHKFAYQFVSKSIIIYFLYIVRSRRARTKTDLNFHIVGLKSEMESLIAKVCFDHVAMRSSGDAPVKRNVNNDTNVYDYYDYLEAVCGGDGGHCRTIDTRRYRYCRFRTLIHTHPTRSTSNSSLVRWRWTTENLWPNDTHFATARLCFFRR